MKAVTIFVNQFTKKYGKQVAVDCLNLEVSEGEIYGLLGPNGAGKTTTFLTLLGIETPTAGKLHLMGQPPGSRQVHQNLGFLPEVYTTYEFLTAYETLEFYARFHPVNRAERSKRIARWVEFFELGPHLNKRVSALSKGLLRRLGFATAVFHSPKILILDEPTWGLDPVGAKLVKNCLIELRDAGSTILLSSHIMSEVERICNRIGILNSGRLVREGPLNDLLRVQERFVIRYRGVSPTDHLLKKQAIGNILERDGEKEVVIPGDQARYLLRQLLDDENLTLISAHIDRVALEDFYLKVVREESVPPTSTEAQAR
ncbi:MAG: ABC transporter ATP-binding protein [bacterium JZ-2024 1]